MTPSSGEQCKLRDERRTRRRLLAKDILRLSLVIAVIVTVGIYASRFASISDMREFLHPDDSILGRLRSYGTFIGAGALLMAIGLPRSVIALVGGGIYGALVGILVSMVAQMIGGAIGYALGRSLLKSTVRRRLGRKRLKRLSRSFAENAFRYTLTLRILPFTNPTVTSLICGVCRVPFRSYCVANLVGFVPQTLLFGLLGSGFIKWQASQLLVGTGLLLVLVLVQSVAKRWAGKTRAGMEAEPPPAASIRRD